MVTGPQDGDQKPGEAERERFGGLTDRIPAAFVDVVLSNLSFLGVLTVSGGGNSPFAFLIACLLYTSPSPRDQRGSRMPSSA